MSDDIKYDPPVTVKAGEIQFIEACHPPLVAGAYTVSMRQLIKDNDSAEAIPWSSDPYASELKFTVDAPRFTLDPADIHLVYPPANQSGRFDNALPHVVFTRRTLPWERTLDGTAPKPGQAFAPWMALLLVQEDELVIRDENRQATSRSYEIRSLPIVSREKDSLLFPAPTENILVPDLGQSDSEKWKKEQGQYEKEFCLTLDLPAGLFTAIAPRTEDLPFLAHVRQVDTGDKEVLAINDKGWFSILIGNRLPQADKDHRVFLVSLEGHQHRLQETWHPQQNQLVRLAVLGSWTFKCEGSNNFKAHMDKLNIGTLNLPFKRYNDGSLVPEDIVNGAYSRGYSAFNHVMRQGEKTVSWYRGPLVPLNYNKPKQIQEPVSCADELLRYDPDTGLFDVTYAAAWQLGRLLALQNQSFALALNRTRKTLRAEAERQMREAELKELRNKLALPAKEDSIEDGFMEQLKNGVGEQFLKTVP